MVVRAQAPLICLVAEPQCGKAARSRVFLHIGWHNCGPGARGTMQPAEVILLLPLIYRISGLLKVIIYDNLISDYELDLLYRFQTKCII